MRMITNSVIPDDCHIFSQRAAFPSSPNTRNLDNCDDGDDFDDLDEYAYELVVRMGIIFFFTSRHCSLPKDRDSYVTLRFTRVTIIIGRSWLLLPEIADVGCKDNSGLAFLLKSRIPPSSPPLPSLLSLLPLLPLKIRHLWGEPGQEVNINQLWMVFFMPIFVAGHHSTKVTACPSLHMHTCTMGCLYKNSQENFLATEQDIILKIS